MEGLIYRNYLKENPHVKPGTAEHKLGMEICKQVTDMVSKKVAELIAAEAVKDIVKAENDKTT